MLDHMLNNDKAKFMRSYSKLANELDNFSLLNKLDKFQSQSQIKKKEKYLNKENMVNFMISERLKNSKQEAKNILSGKQTKIENNNNNFIESFIRIENVKSLKIPKKEIKSKNKNNNSNNNSNNSNSKNFYEKLKTNLNEMRRQFNLEKTFQKNNNNILLEKNIISPKNNSIDSNNNNSKGDKNTNKEFNYFPLSLSLNKNKDKKFDKDLRNILSNDKNYEKLFKLEDRFSLKNTNNANNKYSYRNTKNNFNNFINFFDSTNSSSNNNNCFNNNNLNYNNDIENSNLINTINYTNNFNSSEK